MTDHEENLWKALIAQHRLFFDYDKQTLKAEYAEHIACPVCNRETNYTAMEKDWFRFSKCRDCEMVYTNPRLNELATNMFYNGEWTYLYNQEKFSIDETALFADDKSNLLNWNMVLEAVGTAQGEYLEIGPGGRGVILRAAQEKGFRIHGVELGQDNVAKLRGVFGDCIYDKDLREVKFQPGFFDVVYMRDVFEHVLAPRDLLQEIHRVLKPGGVICLEVPNMSGLIYKLVGTRHICLFGFAHVNYWSPKALRKILSLTGFEVTNLRHKTSDDVRTPFIFNYLFGESTFTTVFRAKRGVVARTAAKVVWRLFNIWGIRHLDATLPLIANACGQGSTMTIVARKRN